MSALMSANEKQDDSGRDIEIDDVVLALEEFEAAWDSGRPPCIEQFLPTGDSNASSDNVANSSRGLP